MIYPKVSTIIHQYHYNLYWDYSLGDVGAVELTQDGDLLLNIVDLILGIFQIDDLDGYGLSRPLVEAFVNFTERALSDTVLLDIVVFGICSLWRLHYDEPEPKKMRGGGWNLG